MKLYNRPILHWLFLPLMLAAITACSGGGGGSSADSGGGIGGTGAAARGSVDGFGSIFVNGVEYETDSASFTIDGQTANESMLSLGMIVTVEGTINSDGLTGTADAVYYDDDVQGPVASLSLSSDGDQLQFTVLGVTVIADRTRTRFDNTSFDTLVDDDLVEVSGLFNGLGDIIASRIERKGGFTPDVSEIEVKGFITNANSSTNTFTLGSFSVNAATADLGELDGGAIANGLQVEVKGTLNAAGDTITASRVESEDDIIANTNNSGTEVSVEGVVANFTSLADFEIAGISVDASGASFEPASLATTLRDDLTIEVEGTIVNGVLIATEVEAEEGDIEAESTVSAVDTINRTLTVGYINGTLTFTLNNQTQLEDDTGIEAILTLDEINVGDFLEIRAYQGDASELIATEIKRDVLDDQRLQGPVDSIDPNVSITVLGVRFITDGATDFEDANENPISSLQFYDPANGVQVGNLIKIQDDITADGTADEVEFEN